MDYLLDANTLIDLIRLRCLVDVLGIASHRFWIAENVRKEIRDPMQAHEVQATIDAGLLIEGRVEQDELELYGEMRRFLGDGEAASLAIAQYRGWGFVSYERGRLAREAAERLGLTRFMRTPVLLAQAVRAGSVSLGDLRATAQAAADFQSSDRIARDAAQHMARLAAEVAGMISTEP